METIVASEIQNILGSKRVLEEHPGAVSLGQELYPQQKSVSSELIQTFNTYGRLVVAANSLQGNSTVSFQIPPASILGPCVLNASVTTNLNVCASSAWLYDLISSVSYSLGGSSSINNISISGVSHRDMILTTCNNESKRNKLFRRENGISGTADSETHYGSVVLALPWSNLDLSSVFPYDTNTLASNITINIVFKPFYKVFYHATGFPGAVLPTAFSSLNLKAFQTDILNSALSLGNAMRNNPMQEYRVPFHLAQTFETTVSITPGNPFDVSLSSLPSGMLEMILVSLRPQAYVGVIAGNVQARPESTMLSSYSLLHNGQTIIDVSSEVEHDTFGSTLYNEGDGFDYQLYNIAPYGVTGGGLGPFYTKIYALPLCRNMYSELAEKRHEHVSSYGGSILQFRGTVRPYTGNSGSSNEANPTGIYDVTFTYLFSALIDNKQRTTSIILN